MSHKPKTDNTRKNKACRNKASTYLAHKRGSVPHSVLYRGRDFCHPSGVTYRNVEKYLMSL